MIKHEFTYLPDIEGRAITSIIGYAEIITPAMPRGFWSVGRLYVYPVGLGTGHEIPETHWIYQPIKLWLLQHNAVEISATVASQRVPA